MSSLPGLDAEIRDQARGATASPLPALRGASGPASKATVPSSTGQQHGLLQEPTRTISPDVRRAEQMDSSTSKGFGGFPSTAADPDPPFTQQRKPGTYGLGSEATKLPNKQDYGLGSEVAAAKTPTGGYGLGSEVTAARTPTAGYGLGSEVTAAKTPTAGYGLGSEVTVAKTPTAGYGLGSEVTAAKTPTAGYGLGSEVTAARTPTGGYDLDQKPLQTELRSAVPLPPPVLGAGNSGLASAQQLQAQQRDPRVYSAAYNNIATELSRQPGAAVPAQTGQTQIQYPNQAPFTNQASYANQLPQQQLAQQQPGQQQQQPGSYQFESPSKAGAVVQPQQGYASQSPLSPAQAQGSMVIGPVIDISKLPRYGLLAPPLPRQLRHAGCNVHYNRANGLFVRNRGILREALENKRGWLEDSAQRMWAEFARNQQHRHVPIPPDANRRVLPETQGYRLRILRVNELPLHTTYDGRTFEFQLGVTLYDEAYGIFYGNTIYSQPDGYDRNKAGQGSAIDLDFSFDVYFHSQVSDPRCMTVVEVIMLERMLDGVVKGEYSLGWALLPLFKVQMQSPGCGLTVEAAGANAPVAVPLVSGTPRYLLLRNVYNEDLRAPKVLQNCSIVFQAEAYPAMDAFIPLLPQDFLVTYSDVVPGLRRFDTSGALSVSTKQVISTLANPMLCPTHSVVLRRLQLALPIKLHELLIRQEIKQRQALPYHGGAGQGLAAMPPGVCMPQDGNHTGDFKYSVRVGVHNGRTFVGPCYELVHVSSMDVPGWKVLQIPAPDAVFDYVMADVMTTIVVELMATPPQVLLPDRAPQQLLVGWASVVPFSFISDDGNQAEVAVGVHRYSMCPRPTAPLLRDMPTMDWRAMLGDGMLKECPDPMVEFQLFETGRTPIPPPLRARFAAIEQQRAEECAHGERPLEEVMAAVPVPKEILQDMNKPCPQPTPIPPVPCQDQGVCTPAIMQLAHSTQTSQHGAPDCAPLRQLTDSRVFDTSDRDQLRDIASAMQRQIELLTRAVDDLKQERSNLRNSIVGLSDIRQSPQPPTVIIQNEGRVRQSCGPVPTPEEIRRLMEMPPTSQFGDPQLYNGGASVVPGGSGTAPSRVLLQQLYDAGMVDALPADVQAMLRQRGGCGMPPNMTMDLAIEAKDARTASDVIIQVLAFRHHDTLNAPASLQSAYFTFQFYHFPPTTTDMAFMVQPHPGQPAPITTAQPGQQPTGSTTAADDDAMRAVRILMTNHPMKKGAGVVLKYCVDGSTDTLPAGVSPATAAYEQHLAFAGYLAAKKLHLDMWDGESLLQVGTASVDLAPLLRQGRAYAEQLIEVPLMMAGDIGALCQPQQAGGVGAQEAAAPTLLSRGSLVVRLINIGREPRNNTQPQADGCKPAQPGQRTRVRAKPAWEVVAGPIARELANGDHPDVQAARGAAPAGMAYLQQPPAPGQLSPAAAAGPGAAGTPLNALRASTTGPAFGDAQSKADKTAAMKHAILQRSHRKSCRVRQLQTILDTDGDKNNPQGARPMAPPGALGEDAFRQVQRQLLTDVTSARCRNKDNYIRDQLRKHMVVRQVVRPGYGEVMVYEHELVNPYAQETVFELRITEPREVSVLTRPDEYRALKASGVRFLGSPSQPGGQGLEQEIMAGNRVFLQANERITLPFKVQSLAPPHGYSSTASAQAVTQAPAANNSNQQQPEQGSTGHVVSVEVVSVTHGHPVGILELHINPKPLIIDRTFRFYHSEQSLMRQTVRLRHLPGADVAFAGGALRTLAAAASHPDVICGTGGVGLTGGNTADRDEVYLKYKCGPAPQVTHFYVLLYADRLLSRPLEVWQVYVHSLRKVDMRCQVGASSTASVVVRGAATSRRVAVHTSHPDELQASPGSFVLVAGALTELLLTFRPVTSGAKDIKVHLVDVESRELVYALIVAAEAQGPLVTRTFEVELPAGSVANKKITYTNPYSSFRTFSLRCSQPWLMSFTPPRLQLPAGATRPVGMTFDARAATCGVIDTLVFVNDEEDRTEECFKVRCRIYR